MGDDWLEWIHYPWNQAFSNPLSLLYYSRIPNQSGDGCTMLLQFQVSQSVHPNRMGKQFFNRAKSARKKQCSLALALSTSLWNQNGFIFVFPMRSFLPIRMPFGLFFRDSFRVFDSFRLLLDCLEICSLFFFGVLDETWTLQRKKEKEREREDPPTGKLLLYCTRDWDEGDTLRRVTLCLLASSRTGSRSMPQNKAATKATETLKKYEQEIEMGFGTSWVQHWGKFNHITFLHEMSFNRALWKG